jgi:hypothetical protein
MHPSQPTNEQDTNHTSPPTWKIIITLSLTTIRSKLSIQDMFRTRADRSQLKMSHVRTCPHLRSVCGEVSWTAMMYQLRVKLHSLGVTSKLAVQWFRWYCDGSRLRVTWRAPGSLESCDRGYYGRHANQQPESSRLLYIDMAYEKKTWWSDVEINEVDMRKSP